MDQELFVRLIEKYRKGIATPSEILLLEAYYQELEYSGELPFTTGEEGMLKKASYHNITTRIHTVKARRRRLHRIRMITWLSAAMITGIFSVMLMNYLQQDTGTHTHIRLATAEGNDVDPAISGAVLTLADGSKVSLDNFSSGRIAEQGSATVVKKDGRILYSSENITVTDFVPVNNISTPYGRQCSLVLPDGSSVYLNAGSSLTFPVAFTGKERHVTIAGEAYFIVSENPEQPFTVTAGSVQIQALGTEFNVNSYEDELITKTTLVEGSVQVKANAQSGLLSPGEQSVFSQDGVMKVHQRTDMEKILAWKNNTFLFEQDELRDIMRQLARWYDVKVMYEGKIPQRHFSGIISRNRKLSAVLELLQKTGNINFTIENKTVTVYP